MMTSTIAKFLGLAAVGVSGLLYYLDQQRRAERAEAEAMEVSYMPEIEVRQWEQFVNQRLALFITREGNMFRVRHQWFDDVTYYPLSQYRVECGIIGVTVDFGGDEFGSSVAATGLLADDEPPLSVHPRSIAAKNLQDRLCRQTVQWMEALASNQ